MAGKAAERGRSVPALQFGVEKGRGRPSLVFEQERRHTSRLGKHLLSTRSMKKFLSFLHVQGSTSSSEGSEVLLSRKKINFGRLK